MIILFGFFPDGSLSATAGNNVSMYNFQYYYLNGSGDHFNGYFYAPSFLYTTGEKIYLNDNIKGTNYGYYYIISIIGDYPSDYNGREVITSYYDADSKKTSYTLYDEIGQTGANHSLNLVGAFTAESGYVYDPSVPPTDVYFGHSDVCYYFTPKQSANFLVTYITDLPYWTQPETLYGSCAAVGGAIILSYWDRNGFDNLIATDWQKLWPNDTADIPSYVALISELAEDMNWGETAEDIAAGFKKYASDHGYRRFAVKYYPVDDERTASWSKYKRALNSGRPASLGGASKEVHHGFVGRGYWNDGHIVVNMGLGTFFMNYRLNWNQTYEGESYSSLKIDAFYDFYDQSKINFVAPISLLLLDDRGDAKF